MESNEIKANEKHNRRCMTKPCLVIFFLSLLLSIAGFFMLGWWLYKYHPTNSQLWMVPFGFILFLTPLIVWLSLTTIPDSCISEIDKEDISKTCQPNDLEGNSL
ncbi:putative ATP-synthase-associated protein [Lupinus albus]|uniref:Putative ATP-synthase-associated protein n=1 Tax=Lupinus albus TaxID=3870 RepID=A0A6A4QYJ5_LUPAL|nr:putative ATP-synthase-associated protein [Lupinus albus]